MMTASPGFHVGPGPGVEISVAKVLGEGEAIQVTRLSDLLHVLHLPDELPRPGHRGPELSPGGQAPAKR